VWAQNSFSTINQNSSTDLDLAMATDVLQLSDFAFRFSIHFIPLSNRPLGGLFHPSQRPCFERFDLFW